MIAAAASFRQEFGLQKWDFVCQEQKKIPKVPHTTVVVALKF